MKLNRIALFDFDGTITTDDSFIRFIRFMLGDVKTIWGMVLLFPMLMLYKLKIIPNYKAKQLMLSYFFKGMKQAEFQKEAEEFSLKHIDSIVRRKAMQKIVWHQERGDKVVVVSASIECWLKPWCEQNNLDLIATKMEMKDGIITGSLATKNCYGIEKVKRIKEIYNLSDYDYVYAYGDSLGDKELLALSDESFYKPFRN